ncbi:MAG: hypothetical protein IH899_08550 [Planctomycetes bacterium]|nr:hypothetical protein [Planctomycetota bacterium]
MKIDSRRELFVDRVLIEELDGVKLKLHEPRPAGVAVRFDQPWEGGSSSYYTVLKDGNLYRMYYRGSSGLPGTDQVTCYAESRDGIHWVKPNLGLFKVQGTRENNVILTPEFAGPATHNFCPFIDKRSGVPASERFKAVGGNRRGGLVPFVSADGIRWRKLREQPIITKGAFDSQNVPFWSAIENQYLCYFRIFQNGVRSVARSTSADFVNWSDPVPMTYGNTPREHIYTNGTHPYFRAPHIYVSLARRFMPGRRVLDDVQVRQLDLERPGNYRGLKNDCSETVLLTSRGGNRYDRTFMEGLVRPGTDLRNWVSRSNTPALGVVPTGEGEMSLFVGRHRGQPSHHLARFTLRTDGFVSVHAPYSGGEMLTHPVRFTGNRLEINYATSAAGSLRVEIQNVDGSPVSGFSLEDCDEIIGDQIARIVSWNGNSDVGSLAEKPVRLRFVMKDADLYSIRFRPEQEAAKNSTR